MFALYCCESNKPLLFTGDYIIRYFLKSFILFTYYTIDFENHSKSSLWFIIGLSPNVFVMHLQIQNVVVIEPNVN